MATEPTVTKTVRFPVPLYDRYMRLFGDGEFSEHLRQALDDHLRKFEQPIDQESQSRYGEHSKSTAAKPRQQSKPLPKRESRVPRAS